MRTLLRSEEALHYFPGPQERLGFLASSIIPFPIISECGIDLNGLYFFWQAFSMGEAFGD